MSYRSVGSAAFVECLFHGNRLGVVMPEPHPVECLECAQFAKVAAMGRPILRVKRRMLCGDGIVCSVCGDPLVSLPTLEQWEAGLSAVWELRDVRLGMVWSNLIPTHFRCWCIIGPNAVNTRAVSLELWSKAAAAAELELQGSVPPPRQLVLSKSDLYAITRQHKQLVRRHESRFGGGTELTAEDLVDAWRAHGGCCAICHDPIVLNPLRSTLRQLSWDRWDNSVGYEASNTRPTCWRCNSAKSAYSVSQCLHIYRQHLAFQAPLYYLPDPGPDFVADEEEVGLVERLRPIYRVPTAACHVRCTMSSDPMSEERIWAIFNAPLPSEQKLPQQRLRKSGREADEYRV
jgi:hypothetical protein